MNIGPALQEIPAALLVSSSKYQRAYDAVVAADGQWVPIAFDKYTTGRSFAVAAVRHPLKFESVQRGLTVFVRLPKGGGA